MRRHHDLQQIRRPLIFAACLLLLACGPTADDLGNNVKVPYNQKPNIIIIFADDQGYGDVGCYGSPNIRTPNIDRLAQEGMKLTNFYAFPSCSPSRAALLTGCYPPRVGFPDVIGPPGPAWTADKQYGLSQEETTLPEILKKVGYATAIIGKWHLGHFTESMPLKHGFDTYFGLPYSNDMVPTENEEWQDLPLLSGEDTLSLNPDQSQLTKQYTEKAVAFIKEQNKQPFFLYLAHSMPHVPLFASAEFKDRSEKGIYVDVIEEIDASVGEIVRELDHLNITDNTLIIYTSDNGPWLSYGNHAGSAGRFREGKGTTYEGGMRVPMLAHWPGHIPAGAVNHSPASLIDILPTLVAITETTKPSAEIDGRDLSSLFLHNVSPTIEPFYYYRSGNVDAVRLGEWKLHQPHWFRSVEVPGNDGVRGKYAYRNTELELYNLLNDPAEEYNVAANHPKIVADLQALISQ
ncbi:MAG: sulfatase, partial [Bacteroidota bacterium]